jgi:hypothetical protein
MKKLLILILLILGAYLFWRWWSADAGTADRGEKLVYNRVWVDHLPKSDTDTVQLFAAITDEPMGIFQASSGWKGAFELFRYESHGDGKIIFFYPQTKEKERAGYRATACSEKGFDFCLELQGVSRGTKRYYSQKGWEIGAVHSSAALRDRIERLEHSLAPAN